MADNTSTMSLENNRSERINALKEQYLQKDLPPIRSRGEEKTGVLMSQLLDENITLCKQVDYKEESFFSLDEKEIMEYTKQRIDNLLEKMNRLKTEQHREKAPGTAPEIAEENEEEKKVLAAGIYDLHKSTDGASAVCKYMKATNETNFTDDQPVIDEILLSCKKSSEKEMKEKVQLIDQVRKLEMDSRAREKLVQKLQDKLIGQAQIMADLRSGLSEKSELVEVLKQQVVVFAEDFQSEHRDREHAEQKAHPSEEYRATLELDLREQMDIRASLTKQVVEKTEQLEVSQQQIKICMEDFRSEQDTRKRAERKIIDLTEKMARLRNKPGCVRWLDLEK